MNHSRRNALKLLALGTIGPAANPALFLDSSYAYSQESAPLGIVPLGIAPLGIALVGLGNYSLNALKPALYQTNLVKLTGIVTGTPAKAQAWSEEFGLADDHVYDYDTFDRIADDDAIDIIYIVLPNFMHAEFTIRALQAGKHVICEKPMGMNARECEAMIAASEQTGKLLSVGYRLHYENHHREAMQLGQDKPFGPINFIEAGLAYHLNDPTLWRLNKDEGGGGAIMDLGVYPIQACRYVSGEEPVAVTAQAFVHDTSRFKDIYETFFWQFEFPSGLTAQCTTSYSSYVDRLYVSCYQGWMELKPSFGGRGTRGATSRGAIDLPAVNQQALHMDDFAQSILDGTPLRVSALEGLQDLRIIDAIKQAIESGQRVVL